eukprot:6175712-Pleurochrysis_carterae.AAC.2
MSKPEGGKKRGTEVEAGATPREIELAVLAARSGATVKKWVGDEGQAVPSGAASVINGRDGLDKVEYRRES